MPANESIREYRRTLAAATPPFLLPRRFVAAESWTKATTQDGTRYLGLLREYEPDLPAILTHRQLMILGEPGAGKSTTGRAIVQHILDKGQPTEIPILASLKGYKGNLHGLLLQTTPADVLDAPELTRTYILDGIDEVPANFRAAVPREIKDLLATDTTARVILTSRQAFCVQHPEAFPSGVTTYHFLDFDDEDIRSCAINRGTNPDDFLAAVREVDCEEEIRNPFVLTVMLERYQEHGGLSPLRSDNVRYVVHRLIQSRPLFNATRQERALRMLAVACETAARNELTEEEALRVLLEAIEFSRATAQQLLDELSQSILTRTAGGISFQMRSYGEYLAAEELHDKPVDRLKELAFVGDTPVDSWLNTVTYLAEMNDKVREYFARHHPEWLVNVSPSAFTDDERTTLARQLLRRINQSQTYLVNQKTIPLRRLARLLTPSVVSDLRAQLTSLQTHEVANALVLLGILRQADIAPQALRFVTEHRNASPLRYAAIVALVNTGTNSLTNDLITFADPGDDYYINIVDAIGSLCTPSDFSIVLPLLERTNAGLSAAYYHFREFNCKEALTETIKYLTANPASLNGYHLDSYLEPIIDLIPTYWDDDTAAEIGLLLAALERQHIFHEHAKLAQNVIKHVAVKDNDGKVIQAMLTSLGADGTKLLYTKHLIAPLVTLRAAQWINDHARQYARGLSLRLPAGPARDLLDPRPPDLDAVTRYVEEEQRREQQVITTRTEHQNTIRTSRDINAIVGACERLPKEHWPEVSPEQHDWLSQQVTATLVRFDLANSIRWETDNRWTHPRGLKTLLDLTDYYHLHLRDDVPLVLSLRSWPDDAITKYYQREGFTPAAQERLVELLRTAENQNIAIHVLNFLRQTGYDSPTIRDVLRVIALDTTQSTQLRIDASERLATVEPATETLLTLAVDAAPAICGHAFQQLVKKQHQATIQRALATLTDDALRAGEVPFPENSSLDWIGNIAAPFAINNLRTVRQRTLALNLWRVTTLVTSTMATIDKARAAAIIRQQLPDTTPTWQQHFRQEAENLERAARVEAVQQTPFDTVIKKLKGATSMIRIKVWCEGPTDRPIFQKLFTELGEKEIADTIDFVGGWPNLLAETQPERWLDGCRQAVIIMDGDVGRKLTKREQPPTAQAKEVKQRFASHPLKLHVLRRHGIENYFPRHACETLLSRDLTKYFPIPPHKGIEEHFCEPQSRWQRCLTRLRRKKPVPFYQKRRNEDIANHLSMADIRETDLAAILNEVKEQAEEAREF